MTISKTLRAISVRCAGKRSLRGLAAVLTLSLCPPAFAESGLPFETLVAVCASCHGENGSTPLVPGWGRIDGQNRDYLVYALALYRANGRRGVNAGLMMPYAMTLSGREIERLAAHFSRVGQPVRTGKHRAEDN